MQYFNISRASEPNIIGVNNGVYQAELVHKKFNKIDDFKELSEFFNHFTYWEKQDHRPKKEFNFEYIKLLKKTKITDLISFAPRMMGIEFILNSKAKSLLDGLKITNSYFFEASVFTFEKQKLDDQYFVLYTTYLGFEAIDFSKTLFYSGSKALGKFYHRFDNFESWKEHWDNPKSQLMNVERIGLKKGYADSDIINTRLGGPFVSERLLDRWRNSNISGFEVSQEPIIELI